MKDITILLTACNSLITPSQIDCLRDIKERKIKIIGVDMVEVGAGAKLVDDFYKLASVESNSYVEELFNICKIAEVDVVIPRADEEGILLSKYKEKFYEIGVIIKTNDYSIHVLAADKGNFLNHMEKNNLPCAKYKIPGNIKEFTQACFDLGYPDFPVVVKPRMGRGNRGVRIIQDKIRRGDLLLNHKPGTPYSTLDDINEALTSIELEKFPDIVVMEYLPGKEYSVDVLLEQGRPRYIIPKERILSAPGLSVIGEVDMNKEVIEAVKEICRIFDFKYNINIQLRYSKDNKLYPYEINTRVAASIGACHAAGANLLYFGIKLVLGEDIPDVVIKDKLKMMRYYKEYYE